MSTIDLKVLKQALIIKYEPHDCEYTMEDNTLFCRHDDSEDWVEVDIEHCIAEDINHYEVYKHFGEEEWYANFLFDYCRVLEEELSLERYGTGE